MFKESIALERLLEIFVAGGLFVIGTWYLHRPFLLEYFPGVAPDVLFTAAPGITGKLLIFFVLAILVGVFITHIFDAIVPLVIGDLSYVDKRFSRLKKTVVFLFKLILPISEPDPRVTAVQRYLDSPRRDWFLAMAKDWCKSTEELLKKKQEMILVHQHVVARLRALSENSREVLQDAYNQVSFAGSIFTAFFLLIPVALLAFYTETLVTKFSTFPDCQLAYITVAIYFASVLSAISLRRRLRNFFGSALTLGLHFYDSTVQLRDKARNSKHQ